MTPDLNPIIPPSPHSHHPSQPTESPSSISNSPSASRRVSQVMGPPPIPGSTASAGPPNTGGAAEISDVGIGPGPLRHPRPMTAADLHLVLEKEQEAVVNRLTRELSVLRQQTASVASTASTTSTGLNDSIDGTSYTTSSRHRSSSSLSGHIPTGSAALAASVSSIAPSRDTALPTSRPSGEFTRVVRSREPSVTSPRQPLSPYGDYAHSSAGQSQGPLRSPVSHSHSHTHSNSHLPDVHRSASNASTAGSRYEETAHHRLELEAVKRENEMLRRRVRELEQSLRTYRDVQPHDESPAHTSSLVAGMRDTTIKDS